MNQIDENKGSKQELGSQSSPPILNDDKIRGLSLIFGSVEKGKSPSTYYFEKAWEVCQQKKWGILEKNATLFSSFKGIWKELGVRKSLSVKNSAKKLVKLFGSYGENMEKMPWPDRGDWQYLLWQKLFPKGGRLCL